MTTLLIPVLVFLATSLCVVAIILVLSRHRSSTEGRLFALTHSNPSITQATPLRGQDPALAALVEKTGLSDRFKDELWRAGLKVRASDFVVTLLLCGVVLGGLVLVLSHNLILTMAAGALGLGIPILVVKVLQGQRSARFEAQLPEALSLASSGLRSGYSFLQSLQVVAREIEAPMSEEAQRVVDEVNMGMPLANALQRLVLRVGSYDTDILVTAITIQYQVGGDLAQLLETIGGTIRERFRVRGEIATLTAEGRISGLILFCLPLALMAVITAINPSYMGVFFHHPLGRLMLVGALTMQCIGGVILLRMVRLTL